MSSTSVPQTFLEDVSETIKACLADGKLDSGEFLKIAVSVAEKANKIANLSDDDKRDLVLTCVEAALKQHLPPGQFEQVESKFVLQVLPTVLDIALSAAHGKFDLKKSVKAVETVGWASCLSCVSSSGEAPAVACTPARQPSAAEPALVAVQPQPQPEAQPQNLSVRVPGKEPLLSPSL